MDAAKHTYALNKQSAEGGDLEDYILEYSALIERKWEIMDERGLIKHEGDGEEVFDRFMTLVEAGVTDEMPEAAQEYGIDSVVGLYDATCSVGGINGALLVLEIDLDQLLFLRGQSQRLLGPEYCEITRQLKKYT